MVDLRNIPVEDLIRSQLQSEEKFSLIQTNVLLISHFFSSHVYSGKFEITAEKKSAPNFDLQFGTVMTELKSTDIFSGVLFAHITVILAFKQYTSQSISRRKIGTVVTLSLPKKGAGSPLPRFVHGKMVEVLVVSVEV